jgi:tRNA (guanosine-2'-O-)-methyltransferase
MRRDDPEVEELAAKLPLPAAASCVIEALAPLLTDARLARIEASVARRTRSVAIALEAVNDPRNVAAVLRSADAFGVQEVHLIEGARPFLASRRITQGAERWLDVVRHPTAQACVGSLRSRGFKVYVATMDGHVGPHELCSADKVAVVFGNEQSGISPTIAALSDGRYTIPMHGFVQSLNVSVAAAITLFCATRDRGASDLLPDEQAELRARFMMLSVERAEQVVAEHLQRRRS